jgi:DNA-binding NarL/FixJ family response regulator
MKAPGFCPQVLAPVWLSPDCSGAKNWRSPCKGVERSHVLAELTHNERENPKVINLDEVKVTPRDQQVLNLLVQGCSNKEIAGQLKISPRTVKQHLRTLFLRAGIREGRKRVKLAIAMYGKEEANS